MLTCFNVKKNIIFFQILYIIVVILYASPLSNVSFSTKPLLSNKCSLLWLANWPSALWLAEHHKHALEM